MKYLFIVQGEGRGHLTQAMTMERLLMSRGHSVVSILVGKSEARQIPSFFEEGVKSPVRYYDTVNFVSSLADKRPSAIGTFFYNARIAYRFSDSIKMIRSEIEGHSPDVIVNFYEMLGSLAHMKYRKRIPMICIGHQFLFLHKDLHIPEFGYEGHIAMDLYSWAIAKNASKILALSFREMADDKSKKIKVVPPLLRQEVLSLRESGNDVDSAHNGSAEGLGQDKFILGYMLNKGFAEEVRKWHMEHPEVSLHFFWDNKEAGKIHEESPGLVFYYLDDKEFLRQMDSCYAYASTGGFESICEAMYLGKPLMMVPSHIEQKCNAYDATKYSAAVSSSKFDLSVLLDFANDGFVPDTAFPDWARSAESLIVKELEDI